MIKALVIFLSLAFSQVTDYETSSIKVELDRYDHNLYIDSSVIGTSVDINLDYHSIIIGDKIYMESLLKLEYQQTIRINLDHEPLPAGTKFFLIDLDDDDIIGPFYSSVGSLEIGPIHSSNFIIQCISPINKNVRPSQFTIKKIIDLSASSIDTKKKYYKKSRANRENPIIVVTGFWPPTNEMIRHFSQNQDLNPEGWEGEDWEELGYDIISFFPEFEDPDCNNCGQGYGDFEVDYQDTSIDFWGIIDALNPVSIITFSRGYIDNSWELEYNYYNRTNWGADYSPPLLPTPNPPDSGVPTNYLRNSTLPMEEIMNAVNNADLGLNSYMDLNGDPGHFVSEFMGYHGVWYHDINEFNGDVPCYLAGHVHVGGLVSWDVSKQAAEITISKVIESLEEYLYIPGDANDDENVDILDLVTVISHILGEQTLEGGSFYAADMNSDGIINIQDIIHIINLIL